MRKCHAQQKTHRNNCTLPRPNQSSQRKTAKYHGGHSRQISRLFPLTQQNTQLQCVGKENYVIIISMVRSTSQNTELKSDLLESLQRLNVALTRANYKLIMATCS